MELLRALGVLSEPPTEGHEAVAQALGLPGLPSATEHGALFVLELPPYASIYLGEEGMIGGEARDRVAGFWRALAAAPPPEPDHLAVLLALYAGVAEGRAPGEARRALLWEHLLSWLPPYLEQARRLASSAYRGWADLLGEALVAEARAFPGSLLPLHLRAAPGLADPREEGLDPFLAALLAPVRSGVILARADLVRAARALGLGLRAGERRFALRALLAQDAPGVLRWLAEEAESWADRHRRREAALAPVSEFWAARAERSAVLLMELSAAAEREVVHA
jgi:hypothetical protein